MIRASALLAPRRRAGWVLVPVVAFVVLAMAAVLATQPGSRIALAIGAPLWCLIAYRYPMIGIAIVSAGQFLLRSLAGTVSSLSRAADTSSSSVWAGALILLPLLAAALMKGDLGRLGRVWREARSIAWPLVAISAAVIIGYLLVPTGYGQLKVIAYMGLNLPLFALPIVLIRSERDARQLLLATIIVSLVTLASSLLGSASIWGASALRGTRAAAAQLADQRVDVGTWLGRRLALGGLAAVAVLLVSRSRFAGVTWLAALVLFGGVGLAASRSPVIGVVLALIVMVVLPPPETRRKGARAAIAIVPVLAATIALVFLPPQIGGRYGTTFNAKDPSLQERFATLGTSLHLIRGAPITGVGLGRYPIAIWGVDRIIYPHSLILEFATELGIPVALLLLVMFGGTLRAGVRASRGAERAWVQALGLWAVGMAIMSFVGAQSSGDLRTNEHVWYAAGVAAAALMARARSAQPQAAHRAELQAARPAELTDGHP